MSAASCGVATPPAAKFNTGKRPYSRIARSTSIGAPNSLLAVINSASSKFKIYSTSLLTCLICLTASTIFPVPGSPFVRSIVAPSPSRRVASPKFLHPQTNGVSYDHLSKWKSSSAGVNTSDSSI